MTRTLLSILLLALLPAILAASEYTHPAFYETDNVTLDNGFRIVMKPRGEVRNVSLRLVVGVGTEDFPCGKKETPHFLEHLLFTGTSKHTESELDDLITENGGTWNAFTEADTTVYTIDIFSKYSALAIDILYEIMTDSTISAENVETSRNIIHRESGGEPSKLRQWLFKRGIGKGALWKAFEYYGLQCPGLETAGDISREEVLSTFREFYVPNNMTLVVVGDFDKREIIERSRETFGKMVRKPVSRLEPESYVDFFGKTFTGTLSPLIGSEAAIFICYPANEELLANRYPLRLVGQYLSDLLYKTIRVEHGLSYSPEAAFVAGEDLGFLCASADVDLEDMDKALELLQREIDSLAASPLDERKVEITKRGLLLRLVQMGESNAEYADYYASNLEDLEHGGRFADNGEQIEIVTAKMMHEAAAKVIHDGRKIVIINEPTLTYTQFYLLMLMLPVLLLAAGWWLYKRRLRLRRIE